MNKSIFSVIIMLISSAVTAADTHCTKTEEEVFTCNAGKKLISVCAIGDGLQYRFGPKGNPELIWPKSPVQKKFVTHGTIMLAGGGGDYLRFIKGQTAYVVYSASTKGGPDKEGVAVEQGGKTIANVVCKHPATSNFGISQVSAIGADSEDFNIP